MSPNRRRHIEYRVTAGMISIATTDGQAVPAYWAYPNMEIKFPGIGLLHDWWGLTHPIHTLSTLFAQAGFSVIAPDWYEGHIAHSPQEALTLYKKYQSHRLDFVNASLSALESHHLSNAKVAVLGIGAGGAAAFEAALTRSDIEAAILISAFPQDYLDRLHLAKVPILAIYGQEDEYIHDALIKKLEVGLKKDKQHRHQLLRIPEFGHEFLQSDQQVLQFQEAGLLNIMIAFMQENFV
ncbi:hypothetical protein MASR2M15_19150 [Anaerolineales bacterium]